MSVNQIIVILTTLLLSAGIIMFYKKIPEKIASPLKTSVLFWMSIILFINHLRGQLSFIKSNSAAIISALVLVAIFTSFSFLICYLVKDKEQRRKIFFNVAVSIFALAYINFLYGAINKTGSFPAHLCRQIGYGLPVVYFSKHLKKHLLPYFTYAAIIGAGATLFPPGNILKSQSWSWGDFDTTFEHLGMFLLGITFLTNGEVKPKLHDIWQFTLFITISAAWAYFCNFLTFVATDKWGNGMYLTESAIDGMPTWLLGVFCIIVATIIIIAFNWKNLVSKIKVRKAKKI